MVYVHQGLILRSDVLPLGTPTSGQVCRVVLSLNFVELLLIEVGQVSDRG